MVRRQGWRDRRTLLWEAGLIVSREQRTQEKGISPEKGWRRGSWRLGCQRPGWVGGKGIKRETTEARVNERTEAAGMLSEEPGSRWASRGDPPVGAKGNPKRDPAPSPVSLAAQVGWGWGARLSPPRSFTKARSVFYQEEFKGWVSRPKVTRARPFPAKPVWLLFFVGFHAREEPAEPGPGRPRPVGMRGWSPAPAPGPRDHRRLVRNRNKWAKFW